MQQHRQTDYRHYGGDRAEEHKEDDPLTKALKEEAERMQNETD